jgi:hypothetical protein
MHAELSFIAVFTYTLYNIHWQNTKISCARVYKLKLHLYLKPNYLSVFQFLLLDLLSTQNKFLEKLIFSFQLCHFNLLSLKS